MSKKKPTYVEFFEEKINELDKRMTELESRVKTHYDELRTLVENITDMSTTDSLMLATFILMPQIPESELSDFDSVMKRIIEKERLKQKMAKIKFSYSTLSSEVFMGVIIKTAKIASIPFEKLAPYLISKLGRDLAKRVVLREHLIGTYGKEALDIWMLLLEKT